MIFQPEVWCRYFVISAYNFIISELWAVWHRKNYWWHCNKTDKNAHCITKSGIDITRQNEYTFIYQAYI